MKYIDADHLSAEIEKRIKEVKDVAERFTPNLGFFDAKLSGIYDVMSIVDSLQQEQPEQPTRGYDEAYLNEKIAKATKSWKGVDVDKFMDEVRGREPEMDLEKFTEKMDSWKARYDHPDNIPIKATMAFTARMFYQYPKVAREWYDSLPKVTLD